MRKHESQTLDGSGLQSLPDSHKRKRQKKVVQNNLRLVKMLLDRGVDLCLGDKNTLVPLFLACQEEILDLIYLQVRLGLVVEWDL